MPLNETSKFKIMEKPFLGRARTKLVVAAGVLNPLEDFILKGYSESRIGFSLLDRLVKSMVTKEEAFYFLGVLSTTGWEGELKKNPPKGDNWNVYLIERGPEGGGGFPREESTTNCFGFSIPKDRACLRIHQESCQGGQIETVFPK